MEKRNIWNAAWLICRDVLLPVLAMYILFFQVFGVQFVVGCSMEPTYGSGRILLINRIQRKDIHRYDVVVVETDNGNVEKKIIKRVIGLPGDVINISQDGDVSINGAVINEPYAVLPTDPGLYHTYPILIPEGYIFIMGDNRPHSSDSRGSLGLVPIEDVVGVIIGSRRDDHAE